MTWAHDSGAGTGSPGACGPGPGSQDTGSPACGSPATDSPATGFPASGSPATGSPAPGSPASGSPGNGGPGTQGTGSQRTDRAGRTLATPAFPDDDGAPDPGLRAALLGSSGAGPGAGRDDVAVLAALRTARVLVPVVAVLDEAADPGDRGLAGEKHSSMAAVLLTGRDGRRALLAFSGLDTLLAWDRQARPVAVSGVGAAQSAVAEDAAALVLDVGSPTSAIVQGVDLQSLAAGRVPVGLADGRSGWLQPPPHTQ